MANHRNEQKNFILAGAFISGLLLLVMAMIVVAGIQGSIFRSKITLYTEVANAQNLKPGAAVQVRGIKTGAVTRIDFEAIDRIKISFQIESRYRPWVRQNSYIAIRTQGVLGDKFLEILGGDDEHPAIEADGFLKTNEHAVLDKFISKGEGVLNVSEELLANLNRLLGSIGPEKVVSIISSLETILEDIKAAEVGKTIQELHKTTYRINHGPGTVHSLIYDPSVHDDLQALLGGAKRNKMIKYFINESLQKSQQ